ncbi:MAG: DUF3089 domain-containing protein [Spirochaetia bacterium]|nr:DUF3089 domain-containing protein [Spirochaetia bacterium]
MPMLVRAAVLILLTGMSSCIWLISPGDPFAQNQLPDAPDYANPAYWAALPDRKDPADEVPSNTNLKDEQSTARVDVFFVHPTLYFGKTWNADARDQKINNRVDQSTIRTQASVFNCCARIYAPRYRQATLVSFINKPNGGPALDAAYSDVLRAFDYYLEHHNGGRPIIIAGHSQGSRHAMLLLKDRFDGKALKQKLLVAYLIGMATPENAYTTIPPCDSASQIGCFISYRSAIDGTEFSKLAHDPVGPYACTNPISWRHDANLAAAELNLGGVSPDFKKIDPGICSARCSNGVLRISKPERSGYPDRSGNYHVSDYALFYMNLRENLPERIRAMPH